MSVIENRQQQQQQQCQTEQQEEDPMAVFLYALKAAETKRQWPNRLKMFLDFLEFKETLKSKIITPMYIEHGDESEYNYGLFLEADVMLNK